MNPAAPVLRLKTPSFAHHGIAFSPFFEDRIAIASGANFGLVGNGRVHVAQISSGGVKVVKWFDTQDCVYDIAWNESHENQILAGCGNGALRLFDIALEGFPVKAWHEHKAEVMAVDWNNIQKDTFVTASWDQTVKIWTTNRATSLLTIPAHPCQIFSASFSPHSPNLLATCGQDGYLKVFDLRSPPLPIWSQRISESDALSCDWNKYDGGLLAVAAKDGVKVLDTRQGGRGLVGDLKGHRLAVRKVAWSPHHRDLLASTSYDMTCRVWSGSTASQRSMFDQHTEFVMGLAWALFDEGLLTDCAWDEEVHLFRA